MPETKTILAKDLSPRQTMIDYRQLGSEVLEIEREIMRVHHDEIEGLVLVEFRDAGYDGEGSFYPADSEIDIVV